MYVLKHLFFETKVNRGGIFGLLLHGLLNNLLLFTSVSKNVLFYTDRKEIIVKMWHF